MNRPFFGAGATTGPYDGRLIKVGAKERGDDPAEVTFIACDMGNTNTRFGIFTEAGLDSVLLISSRAFAERMSAELRRYCEDSYLEVPTGCPSAVVSVTPHHTFRPSGALLDNTGRQPVAIGRDRMVPLENRTRYPERVGLDRLVDALAAYTMVGGACVVIDVGTAITVDAVSADGAFLGGAIAPGPGTMLRGLGRNAEQLQGYISGVDLSVLPEGAGKTTEEAISLGVIGMSSGGVELLIDAMRTEVGQDVPVIGTGGALRMISPYLVSAVQEEPYLSLEGIRAAMADIIDAD